MMKHITRTLILIVIATLAAEGGIADAWREYEYQNFDGAREFFQEVVEDQSSSDTDRLQARIGLVMAVQYRIPGNDPKKAIPQYQEILKDQGITPEVAANLNLLIGRAYMELKEPDLESAGEYFRKVLEQFPGFIEAHQAALQQAYILSHRQTEEDFRKTIAYLQAYCDANPGNELAGTMHLFCADLAFPLKDYALARQHLIDADSLGIVNIRRRPVVLYQIAYMSDHLLNDIPTARRYYAKMIEEYGTEGLVLYCRTRLEELGEKAQ